MMETYHEWYDTLFGMLVDAHGWHIGRCTCWHMVDIFHGWYLLAHCWCTWLMYMGVVHGGHILVHDAFGGYIFHDSLFHCWHIFCFMVNGISQVWCMNRSKDHHMVAYLSSCKEERGSHSSSHDSRRRYLSDAYLEKSPIFEERAKRHNSRRSDGHRGSMFDVSLVLH